MANYSAEIRWFATDPGSAELLDNFFYSIAWRAEGGEKEAGRKDHYLETGLAGTGIKLRDGSLEIKERTGGPKLLEVNEKPVGNMESWVKWSFEAGVEQVQAWLSGTAGPGRASTWIPVFKERRKKVFGIKGYRLYPARPGEILSIGCLVEHTKLSIPGSRAICTLGYEAFGEPSACERTLIYALEQTINTDSVLPGPELSASYPAFLMQALEK